MPPLSDLELRSLKPKEKPYKVADGERLFVFVARNGGKRFEYRFEMDGKARGLSLGTYPDTTLKEAREKRDAARKLVKNGIDPVKDRQEKNEQRRRAASNTFGIVAQQWVEFKSSGWATETKRKAEFVLERYLTPALGKHDIATLATKDVTKPLTELASTAPNLARKARQYIGGIVRYAQRNGLRDETRALPLDEVIPKFDKGHIPAATIPDDIAKMLRAVHDYDTVVVRAALLMCAYTAQRPGVIASMRWDEVKGDEWHIPGPKMKMRHAHVVPLPRQAIELLDEMRAFAGGKEFVFPPLARQKTPHLHRDALSNALRRMGFAGQHATHGFRGMLRTVARERLGIPADVLEAQLAHAKKGDVQKAYDRTTFTDERRQAMQRWADYLDQLRDNGNVVPIRRKKIA